MDDINHIIQNLKKDQVMILYVKDYILRRSFHQQLNDLSWDNLQYSHTSMYLQGLGAGEIFSRWNFCDEPFLYNHPKNYKTIRKNAIIIGSYLYDYWKMERDKYFYKINLNKLIQENELTYIFLQIPHKRMKKNKLRIFFEVQIIFKKIILLPEHIYEFIFNYI
jgi:hypothetical protein